jgi:hypothetical protein
LVPESIWQTKTNKVESKYACLSLVALADACPLACGGRVALPLDEGCILSNAILQILDFVSAIGSGRDRQVVVSRINQRRIVSRPRVECVISYDIRGISLENIGALTCRNENTTVLG